jgi:hypothetical protein
VTNELTASFTQSAIDRCRKNEFMIKPPMHVNGQRAAPASAALSVQRKAS